METTGNQGLICWGVVGRGWKGDIKQYTYFSRSGGSECYGEKGGACLSFPQGAQCRPVKVTPAHWKRERRSHVDIRGQTHFLSLCDNPHKLSRLTPTYSRQHLWVWARPSWVLCLRSQGMSVRLFLSGAGRLLQDSLPCSCQMDGGSLLQGQQQAGLGASSF